MSATKTTGQTNDLHPRIHTAPVPLAAAAQLVDAAFESGELGDPGDFTDVRPRTEQLLFLAARAGLETLDQMVGATGRTLVALAAGVPQLGNTLTSEQAQTVAPWRNALLAVHAMVAYALDIETDLIPAGDLPASPLRRSTGHRCTRPRPWRDDEILLVRVHFLADTDPRSLRPGIAYALLEAGMTSPDAATAVRDNLCDATGQPLAEGFTHVSAPTEGRRGNRTLRLTDFGRQLISRNLELMRQADFAAPDRLTYGGTGFGLPKAAASVQGYLNNHATWAGVDDRQTNVTGIALWRQNQILHADGLDAALDCAFGDLLTGDEDRYLPLAGKLLKHLHRSPAEARRFIRH